MNSFQTGCASLQAQLKGPLYSGSTLYLVVFGILILLGDAVP